MDEENNMTAAAENTDAPQVSEDTPPLEEMTGTFEYEGEKFQVPEQFFDKENGRLKLGALLKSQSDLRRQVSSNPSVPEKYTFNHLNEEKDALLIKALDAFGHSGKIPQEKMDGLIEALAAAGTEFKENVEKETAGEFSRLFAGEAKKTRESVTAWVNGLIGEKVKNDPALQNAVDDIAESPHAVFIINAIKDAVKTDNVSPSSATAGGVWGIKTEDELDAMVKNPKYRTDPDYRRKVEAEFRRKYGAA